MPKILRNLLALRCNLLVLLSICILNFASDVCSKPNIVEGQSTPKSHGGGLQQSAHVGTNQKTLFSSIMSNCSRLELTSATLGGKTLAFSVSSLFSNQWMPRSLKECNLDMSFRYSKRLLQGTGFTSASISQTTGKRMS